MTGRLLNRVGLFALVLSVAMAGCETAQEGALVGPGEKDEILITYRTDDGYTMARETDPSVGVVTAVIDQKGGVLSIGKHLLWVPEGAVSAPTTFVMTKFPGQIKVDLSATRLLFNDVGKAGFLKPVRLTLSYSDIANVTYEQISNLKILWVRPDGSIEVQQSFVDRDSKVVKANLNHFSIYTMGWGVD